MRVSQPVTDAIRNSLLTTRGDMIRRGASAPERFAKGSQGQGLAMGANDPAWYALSTSGSYTGDGTANRAIPHGLSICTPALVFIIHTYYRFHIGWASVGGGIFYATNGAVYGFHAVTVMDGTNFYVGNAANYDQSANKSGDTYRWVAFR